MVALLCFFLTLFASLNHLPRASSDSRRFETTVSNFQLRTFFKTRSASEGRVRCTLHPLNFRYSPKAGVRWRRWLVRTPADVVAFIMA
jgi:hypothetical protein